jgi:hypothetical protein
VVPGASTRLGCSLGVTCALVWCSDGRRRQDHHGTAAGSQPAASSFASQWPGSSRNREAGAASAWAPAASPPVGSWVARPAQRARLTPVGSGWTRLIPRNSTAPATLIVGVMSSSMLASLRLLTPSSSTRRPRLVTRGGHSTVGEWLRTRAKAAEAARNRTADLWSSPGTCTGGPVFSLHQGGPEAASAGGPRWVVWFRGGALEIHLGVEEPVRTGEEGSPRHPDRRPRGRAGPVGRRWRRSPAR